MRTLDPLRLDHDVMRADGAARADVTEVTQSFLDKKLKNAEWEMEYEPNGSTGLFTVRDTRTKRSVTYRLRDAASTREGMRRKDSRLDAAVATAERLARGDEDPYRKAYEEYMEKASAAEDRGDKKLAKQLREYAGQFRGQNLYKDFGKTF